MIIEYDTVSLLTILRVSNHFGVKKTFWFSQFLDYIIVGKKQYFKS